MHLWNVISYILGLRKELLPEDGKEAYWLEKAIRKRKFRSSVEGVELTNKLIASLEQQANGRINPQLIGQYMTFLLGDEIAEILEINNDNNTANISTLINVLKNFGSARRTRSLVEMKQEMERQGIFLAFPKDRTV